MTVFRFALCGSLAVMSCVAHAADKSAVAELGRQIFEENWLTPPADDSPLAVVRGGDGLGPLYNGASCATCHYQAGVGGAGASDKNIEIISLALPLDTPTQGVRKAVRVAARLHPGFRDSTNVFLHRFGQDTAGSLEAYQNYREEIRSRFPEEVTPATATQVELEDGLAYQLAQRNTPALFGVGLIDGIDAATLNNLAMAQKRIFPDVAGRVANGGSGRFGWRGQISSLEDFVRTACTVELGLRVKKSEGRGLLDQPSWPVDGTHRSRERRRRVDLSESQVAALVEYVRSLPAPQPRLPADADERSRALHGRQVFSEIGCAVCHQQDVGVVKNIYSDLLLHDMGAALADRVAAPLPPPATTTPTVTFQFKTFGPGQPPKFGANNFSTFGPADFAKFGTGDFESLQSGIESIAAFYSGGSVTPLNSSSKSSAPATLEQRTAATQEFRTPPLWGVADSSPYLHDGRAETLDEAIRLHGGQGQTAALAFLALPKEDRSDLLAFLGTLKAPPSLD